MIEKFKTEWGGKELSIEVGRFAAQTNGACVVRYGDTVVLATAVMGGQREGLNFFPLTVDVEEKLWAAGKIKGSRFMKREGRASDDAIVTGRMIDRSIRPLFDSKLRNDVQVVITPLSVDQENDSDIPGFIAASAALSISDIPWAGPIVAARVGRVGGEWVLNPTFAAREKSDLDLVVAGTSEKAIMLEAGSNEVAEDEMVEGIKFAQKHFRAAAKLIDEVVAKVGATKVNIEDLSEPEDEEAKKEREELIAKAREFLSSKVIEKMFNTARASKAARKQAKHEIEAETESYLKEQQVGKEKRKAIISYVEKYVEEAISAAILKEEKRVDGRGLHEVRPLSADVGILPRTHGSALFQRGETQVLSTVTLGSPGDEQTIEGMEVDGKKRYMHHYEFPPYSVGETGPMRGPGRRDIGHGALAEKALLPVLPSKEEFPYTIRVFSAVMGSNGSSSMGSTCGSSLSLMDAGVPIKAAVAGVAMGIAQNKKGDYKIFTDLQDLEDSDGGMDFKVAGTRKGITAIQMDTKSAGLTFQMVKETLDQAREGRLKILDAMDAAINAPRPELSQYAPRIVSFKIDPEKIREVIGPGGKMINAIIDKCGVEIDVEQDGTVSVTSTSAEGMQMAVDWIKSIVREAKVGEIFHGKVVRLMDFGAFVEILPGQDGLVHISEIAPFRVNRVTDFVNLGDEVPVVVTEIDEMGRTNLSIKQAREKLGEPQFVKPEGYEEQGGFGGGFRDGGSDGPRRGPFRPRR
ncbi:MAG: polyribonucleotide nucleotidyltransferase [Patescibacteria group bacterium]